MSGSVLAVVTALGNRTSILWFSEATIAVVTLFLVVLFEIWRNWRLFAPGIL